MSLSGVRVAISNGRVDFFNKENWNELTPKERYTAFQLAALSQGEANNKLPELFVKLTEDEEQRRVFEFTHIKTALYFGIVRNFSGYCIGRGNGIGRPISDQRGVETI